MIDSQPFKPSWFSKPGDTIQQILLERGVELLDFSIRIGFSIEKTRKLLHGVEPIDDDTAEKLSQALGASKQFWLSRENDFREAVSRCKHQIDSDVASAWVKSLPVNELRTRGWIDKDSDRVESCMAFFDIPSLEAWESKYSKLEKVVAFRKTNRFPTHTGAVIAWLRRGEILSREISCNKWNREKFLDALIEVRRLTLKKSPKTFLPRLVEICREVGVAVVVAQTPAGCRASGATRFLNSEKAMILLSFRYLSDDHFWFTFFHEAGHLVLHSDDALFIEDGSEATNLEEQEANDFAKDLLIPHELQKELSTLKITAKEIIRFAQRARISPGVVLGQLQFMGRVKHNWLNNLKRRYSWEEIVV